MSSARRTRKSSRKSWTSRGEPCTPRAFRNATATARSTFCVVQQAETVALQPIVVGRYADAFSRDQDGWYFTERRVDIEMLGDTSAHLLIDPGQFS